MADHWQVIEDALRSYKHLAFSQEEVDAALAFVREMKRVPTERTPQEGRWEVLTGDSTDYRTTEPSVGIWAYHEDGHEISISTKDVEIFAPLPDNIRLCRWQDGDTPVAATPQGQPQPDWSNAPSWANYACLWLYTNSGSPFFRWRYFEHEPVWGERNYNRTKGKWDESPWTQDMPLSTFVDIRTLQQRPQPWDAAKDDAHAPPDAP